MTQSKTARGSQKKSTAKAKTRYYVVRTVEQARTDLTNRLEDYNRKYIVQPLETGKTFVQDLKAEPRKVVVNLFKDGKARITDLNKDAWTRVNGLAKDGRAFLTKAGKSPRETFNDLIDDGKEVVEDLRSSTRDKLTDLVDEAKRFLKGVEKDTYLVMADVIDGGKKALDQVPGKQRIEKEISSRMKTIPAKFNLPSKKDIDSLVSRVKQLNAKVDALTEEQIVVTDQSV
jgi:polyhydroxyalkanoate synthesis regulator phasin